MIMNKIFRNGLLMLAAGAFVVSCADYNETDNFYAEPDPTVTAPYNNLGAVKSYINRDLYPNMTLGAQLKVEDFNKHELAHAAAVSNFNNYAFGTTLMSSAIVNDKGVMNFLAMKELLDHVDEIGGEVYGSPLFANANQPDGWLKTLTEPIEIPVDFVEGKSVNFNEMKAGDTYNESTIAKYDDQNCLKIGGNKGVTIISDFEVDTKATYTTTFYAKVDKAEGTQSYFVVFCGDTIDGGGENKKWSIKAGKWTKVVVENKCPENATAGTVKIANLRGSALYIQKVQVGYYPDNHRPQTDQELKDTINYAINAWCDGVMKINDSRIKMFDLIDEPIDVKSTDIAPGIYDIKHNPFDPMDKDRKIFWQDVLGSEKYAPVVGKVASEKYTDYGGNAEDLKFFISEIGLEEEKKFESLKHWIKVWENNGAKIDGINAKVTLSYSEDVTTQAANKAAINTLLDNLATTGKLIRLSNFDIKYLAADGTSVSADKITKEQRQTLADYNAEVIKAYMAKIPNDKQAGICKGNMVDTSDPVGLWSKDAKKDWARTATYEAFCKALSGE